jgi:hypothetical protein
MTRHSGCSNHKPLESSDMEHEQIEQRIAEIRNGYSRPKRGELARLIAKSDAMRSGVDRQRKSRLKREQARREESLAIVTTWQEGVLKRGPRPDPTRQNADCCVTVRITKREARALSSQHDKLCRDASPSTFLRFVLCQWLEAQREPQRDPVPFDFDPNNLDWRTKIRGNGASGIQVAP